MIFVRKMRMALVRITVRRGINTKLSKDMHTKKGLYVLDVNCVLGIMCCIVTYARPLSTKREMDMAERTGSSANPPYGVKWHELGVDVR